MWTRSRRLPVRASRRPSASTSTSCEYGTFVPTGPCGGAASSTCQPLPRATRTRRRRELYFDLGRYLLVAGSRRGTQPLTLQGIWNADARPAWSSNFTTNINTPMNYWGAEATGLGELHEPLLDLVADLLDAGRRTAHERYGARGACVHHNTDLWRFTDPVRGCRSG